MIRGNKLKMTNKLVVRANNDDTGRRYETNERNLYEGLYRNLALLLEIEDAWTSDLGSALDEFLKVDLVIQDYNDLVEGKVLVFQIKSSKFGADKHLYLCEVKYQNNKFLVPPVLVPDKPYLELLLELSEFTGIPLRENTIAAIELYKATRGKTFPRFTFKSYNNVWLTLQLATIKGDSIVIN